MRKILCVLLAVVFVWGSLPVSAETAESVSVSAYAAVLYEPVSGTVLFEKNSREVLPVASTTKIMTALLAFESEHRGDPVTITPEMISVEGSSMGLRAGEMLALGDIARGMMMASGNDGANAIALYLSDSTEAFSEKMNARAAELHMMQTHFVTPSGLDAEGHGSTAYDMALLAAEAMQNEEFAAAVGQTTLSVHGHQNGLYEKGRALPCVFRRAGRRTAHLCDIKCPGRLERPHEFVRLRLCTACRANIYGGFSVDFASRCRW